jgi:hypothetical protein
MALMGKFLPAICIFHQPRFDHFSLESPLIADLKGGQFLLSEQPVDGEPVYIQVFSDFFEG